MDGVPSKYKLVIFDFDGTLADSFPWFMQAMNRAADKFHFKRVEAAEVETVRGYNPRQILAHLQLPAWKVPFVARFMRRSMTESISEISLFEGVDEMLETLSSKGIGIAILTSNAAENVRRILGRRNNRHVTHFECSVSAFGKRRQLRKLLKASGVCADEAVYIGDEIRDAEAAHAEGIDFIGVSWGYAHADALQPFSSMPVLRSMSDIPSLENRSV